MKLEHSFEVAAPLERVWEALIDVERIAPCLPGATIVARNQDGGYDGEFKVKIGPTSAAYSGQLHADEVDAPAHRATVRAAGTDKRGQGGAKATIVATVAQADEQAATVAIEVEYRITGRLARFARGGTIEEISVELLAEFAENLRTMLAPDAQPEPDPAPASEPPATHDPIPEPIADPDGAFEGASPFVDPETEPDAEPDRPSPVDTAPSGGALVERIGANPVPLLALVLGFLLALRVLRRRS